MTSPPPVRHSRRQTILNAVSSWADMICQGVMGVLLVPLLIERLGKDGFGLVCLLNVIVIYSSFADLGIRGALGRDLSAFAAQGDRQGFTSLLTSAALVLMAIAGVLTAGFYIFRTALAQSLQIPAELTATVEPLIPVYCGGMVALGFITPVFSSAVTAINRFDSINFLRTAITLAGNVALLVLLQSGEAGLVRWCSIVLATQTVLLAVTVCSFLYHCRPYLASVGLASCSALLSLMHFGGKVFGLTFALTMGTQTDPVILSAFMGPGAVAIYSPATRISAMIRPMVMVLAQTLYPITTLHHTTNNAEQMRGVLLKGTRYTMVLGALATVGVVSLAAPFCQLWLGDALGADSSRVATILGIIAAIDLLEYAAGTQWPVLIGQRQIDFLLWIQVPLTLINIGLSIFLVGYTEAGIAGVLLATLIISAIRRPIVLWHTAARCNVPLSSYLVFSYVPAVFVLVTLGFVAGLLRIYIPTDSWARLTAHASALVVAWIPFAFIFGITPEDREAISRMAGGWVKRISTFVTGC